MIKKVKHWFYERFLTALLKELLLEENRALREENEQLRQKLALKDAYIDGLAVGVRSQRRIVINNGGDGKK